MHVKLKHACVGLQILDVVDCTGSGDVDMSKVVKADDEGHVIGVFGDKLRVNPAWNNPSGELCFLQPHNQPSMLCFKQVTPSKEVAPFFLYGIGIL